MPQPATHSRDKSAPGPVHYRQALSFPQLSLAASRLWSNIHTAPLRPLHGPCRWRNGAPSYDLACAQRRPRNGVAANKLPH